MKRQQVPKILAALLLSISSCAFAIIPTIPTPIAEPAKAFGFGGLLQAGSGLAVVVGLIFACAWAARRLGLQPSGGGKLIKVVSSALVGQRERVVVVEINDTWLILGVAAGQVQMLHSMPSGEVPMNEVSPAENSIRVAGAFSQKLLDQVQKLKKARNIAR